MIAITYHQYGGPEVLQIEEWENPSPRSNEILIKTHATTVTSGDWRVRSLSMPPGLRLIARMMFGISQPRQPILGSELAGEVVEIGKDVKKFNVGDRVVIFTGSRLGCSVEYKCISADDNVVLIPDQLSFADAVALPFGGTTALDFFRKGNLERGEHVLINGASGCVGTLAVQTAKQQGAHVTGVCSNKNVELVRSLGADVVIDYQAQDFTKLDRQYDIIMDTAASSPLSRCKSILKPGGRLLVVNGGLFDLLRGPLVSLTSDKKLIAGPAAERLDDLEHLIQLARTGALRAVVDQIYSPSDIHDAHRHVDSGRKTGSVVIQWA